MNTARLSTLQRQFVRQPAFTIDSMQQTVNQLTLSQSIGGILDAPAPVRLWHLLSLDAPTVALAWSLGFAKAAGVRLPAWVPLLLALVTWCVYIGDRLLDARSALRTEQVHHLRQRHLFHWQHRRGIFPLALAAACVCAWIVFFFMPDEARERNALLALAGVTYFSCIHTRTKFRALLPKELLVAVLFTAGCVLPTIGRMRVLSAAFIVVIFFFAGLAWLNCHAIECWESGGRAYSGPQIHSIAGLLALAGLLCAIVLFALHSSETALIGAGAASAGLLALLDGIRDRLTPLALRSAADLVLLTPLVLLLR
ncbi:MAG: hypothetical protein ABSD59_14070 [Terracidiphilus sp.]